MFSGCSPGGEPAAPAPAEGLAADPNALSGEVVTYVADFEDGRSERWMALRQANGRETRLEFDGAPSVTSGQRAWVRGHQVDEKTLHVTDIEVAAERVGALSADSPDLVAAPATDSYALVLVDLGAGVNLTAAAAQARLTSAIAADRSFAAYYNESSYGKYNVTGTVLGPFPYAMTTCNTSGMATAIEAMIPNVATAYNHVIFYFNRTTLCTFGGLGEEGSSARPSRRTWMNGSLNCVVLMQEPGHNLGLMHANTMNCNGASFSTTPATSCIITEYGSQLDHDGRWLPHVERLRALVHAMDGRLQRRQSTGDGHGQPAAAREPCPGGVQVLAGPLPRVAHGQRSAIDHGHRQPAQLLPRAAHPGGQLRYLRPGRCARGRDRLQPPRRCSSMSATTCGPRSRPGAVRAASGPS